MTNAQYYYRWGQIFQIQEFLSANVECRHHFMINWKVIQEQADKYK